MEVTLLGTGTSIPHPERASSGCLVRTGQTALLFDIGSGSLKRLAETGVSYLEIDYLFLTHFHPDHTGDLLPLLFAFRNPFFTRTRRFTIGGPSGLRGFYKGLIKAYGSFAEPLDYELDIVEVRSSLKAEEFRLTTVSVPHTAESVAYRVESGGRSFVLSGDTGTSRSLIDFSRNADVLLLECSFTEELKAEGHLTPAMAGSIAEEAGAAKLVLTHFYPVFDGHDIVTECRKTYGGEIVVGSDLLNFTV